MKLYFTDMRGEEHEFEADIEIKSGFINERYEINYDVSCSLDPQNAIKLAKALNWPYIPGTHFSWN